MTTASADALRAPAALVLNDMINSNLRGEDAERTAAIDRSGFVGRTADCVAGMRCEGVPVFWIQVERRADRLDVVDTLVDLHPRRGAGPLPPTLAGSTGAANVDELPVLSGDHVVVKPRMDPFTGTHLDLHLRSRGIRTVLLGGYSTNGGVESACRTAHDLGYDVVVLSDCCYNVEEDAHEFALTRSLPYYSRVRTAAEALTMLRGGHQATA